MSTDRETTRVVRSWLDEGVTKLPDRVLDAVLDQVPATPQRRSGWSAWRSYRMNTYLKLAARGSFIWKTKIDCTGEPGFSTMPAREPFGAVV